MTPIIYRQPQLGDEYPISGCLWAAADLWELADGTPDSVSEWLQICHPDELRARIVSDQKTRVATWNGVVVGFIAFKRGNHLSLLFVRREFSGQGIGRALFDQCAHDFDRVTVNAAEAAVGFYQRVGFIPQGDRCCSHGTWSIPMIWTNPAANS